MNLSASRIFLAGTVQIEYASDYKYWYKQSLSFPIGKVSTREDSRKNRAHLLLILFWMVTEKIPTEVTGNGQTVLTVGLVMALNHFSNLIFILAGISSRIYPLVLHAPGKRRKERSLPSN